MRACALLLIAGCSTTLADLDDTDALLATEAKLGAAHGVEHEEMEYEMQIAGVLVARVQVVVGGRGMIGGRPAVIVRSRAVPAGAATMLGDVAWELTTTIDIDSGFAIAAEEEAGLGDRRSKTSRTWPVDARYHNAHSAAGALRGWMSAAGAHDAVDVELVDTMFDATIRDAARETIGSTFGSRRVARYDGLLRGKHPFSAWLTDDTARVPLRLRWESRIGDIDVELVAYDVAGDP